MNILSHKILAELSSIRVISKDKYLRAYDSDVDQSN